MGSQPRSYDVRVSQTSNSSCHKAIGDLPSGKPMKNYGLNHHAINGTIHYFNGPGFNSYLVHYQRVTRLANIVRGNQWMILDTLMKLGKWLSLSFFFANMEKPKLIQ